MLVFFGCVYFFGAYYKWCFLFPIPSGKHLHNYIWKITILLMGKSTISMAIFNSYVCLPEGKWPINWHHMLFAQSFARWNRSPRVSLVCMETPCCCLVLRHLVLWDLMEDVRIYLKHVNIQDMLSLYIYIYMHTFLYIMYIYILYVYVYKYSPVGR